MPLFARKSAASNSCQGRRSPSSWPKLNPPIASRCLGHQHQLEQVSTGERTIQMKGSEGGVGRERVRNSWYCTTCPCAVLLKLLFLSRLSSYSYVCLLVFVLRVGARPALVFPHYSLLVYRHPGFVRACARTWVLVCGWGMCGTCARCHVSIVMFACMQRCLIHFLSILTLCMCV